MEKVEVMRNLVILVLNLLKNKILMFKKDKNGYLPYGQCPGFFIWLKNGSVITGHMIVKKSDTKDEIKNSMIEYVTKKSKEYNLSIEETRRNIHYNLEHNNLYTNK